MRISTMPSDPGHQAYLDLKQNEQELTIALDGELLNCGGVMMADEEKGLVLILMREDDGSVAKIFDGSAVSTYRSGRVVIGIHSRRALI